MKLRKECPHGRYDRHNEWVVGDDGWQRPSRCPGGEFLADDALVIEKVQGKKGKRKWPEDALESMHRAYDQGNPACRMEVVLDALTVREGAG